MDKHLLLVGMNEQEHSIFQWDIIISASLSEVSIFHGSGVLKRNYNMRITLIRGILCENIFWIIAGAIIY